MITAYSPKSFLMSGNTAVTVTDKSDRARNTSSQILSSCYLCSTFHAQIYIYIYSPKCFTEEHRERLYMKIKIDISERIVQEFRITVYEHIT